MIKKPLRIQAKSLSDALAPSKQKIACSAGLRRLCEASAFIAEVPIVCQMFARKAAIDTPVSLGMKCSECTRIPKCRTASRPLPQVCGAASIYEPHQGCLVVRLGPGANSREVGKFHIV